MMVTLNVKCLYDGDIYYSTFDPRGDWHPPRKKRYGPQFCCPPPQPPTRSAFIHRSG
jgi:hypothetical protein